jgi:hypothetical protein
MYRVRNKAEFKNGGDLWLKHLYTYARSKTHVQVENRRFFSRSRDPKLDPVYGAVMVVIAPELGRELNQRIRKLTPRARHGFVPQLREILLVGKELDTETETALGKEK